MVQFQKNLYFWNENKKLDWMDQTNVQNLRKNSNANVLQIFVFALQMWVTIWAGKPDDKRNVFTLWQEFRSQCLGQIQMNTLIISCIIQCIPVSKKLMQWSKRKSISRSVLKQNVMLEFKDRLYWFWLQWRSYNL